MSQQVKANYSSLSATEKKIIGKGCGPGVGFLEWLIPDLLFHADCKQHDFYYARGGGLFDKVEADLMFFAYMTKSINDKVNGFFKKLGYFICAKFYFMSVSIFGVFLWNWGRYRTKQEIIRSAKAK